MQTSNFTVVTEQPMKLGECPIWDVNSGSLYWIDIPGRAVHHLHPASGARQHWDMPAEPGCIALTDKGRLLVALRHGIFFLSLADGQLQLLVDAPYDTTKMRFNDGRCDPAGRLWVGALYEPRDQAAAPLYCLERGQLRDSGLRATVSNGVAFAADGRTLYHADTTAHRVCAYDLDPANGQISRPRTLRQFSSVRDACYGGRPDGAAIDSEGAYWCAMLEGDRLLRLTPDGEVLQELPLPVRSPTMMAFGGEDLRTLYITSARNNRSEEELARRPLSGHVISTRVAVPGIVEHAYLI